MKNFVLRSNLMQANGFAWTLQGLDVFNTSTAADNILVTNNLVQHMDAACPTENPGGNEEATSADYASNLATRQSAQNAARTDVLDQIAGNPGKVATAEALRDAATTPMRESVLARAGNLPEWQQDKGSGCICRGRRSGPSLSPSGYRRRLRLHGRHGCRKVPGRAQRRSAFLVGSVSHRHNEASCCARPC